MIPSYPSVAYVEEADNDEETLSFPQSDQVSTDSADATDVPDEPEPQTIAVTGKFAQGHAAIQARIEAHPLLRYSPNVTRDCACLISSQPVDDYSVKVRMARRYNVPIQNIAHLAQLLGVDVL